MFRSFCLGIRLLCVCHVTVAHEPWYLVVLVPEWQTSVLLTSFVLFDREIRREKRIHSWPSRYILQAVFEVGRRGIAGVYDQYTHGIHGEAG